MTFACAYELRCQECGRSFGNQPLTICDECFSPLEVCYDIDSAKGIVTRESIAAGPASIWRYAALLPVPQGFQPDLPVGFTPLVRAPRLAARIFEGGSENLYVKNDAVCMPTLSFKDRV